MFESILLKIDELDGSLRQFYERLKGYIKGMGGDHYDTYSFGQREVRMALNVSKSQLQRYIYDLLSLEYIAMSGGYINRGYRYRIVYWDDITRICLRDIDLENGTIYIRDTIRTHSRILTLRPNQVMLFYEYIHRVRPALLKTDTDALVITHRGTAENGERINYLVETFKPLFPDRNLNARTIRQSVITNLLKEGKDLRVVQVFAWHKKISTTERYRQSGLKELQAAIEKHHPLG